MLVRITAGRVKHAGDYYGADDLVRVPDEVGLELVQRGRAVRVRRTLRVRLGHGLTTEGRRHG